MKKTIFLILAFIFIAFIQSASACVGKTLFLGIISNAPHEKLLAEMASLLIAERTGSAVKIQAFRDSKELYAAIKQGKVNILIENTDRALEVLGKSKEKISSPVYETIKTEFKTSLNMIWLEPFGGPPQYAPVLTSETLSNYPALPKLLNKMAGVLKNDSYAKLMKSVDSEDKARKVAKDFLKSKKLI